MLESRTTDFLDYLCRQIIPVDLMDVFQQAGVPFFEGCLIVEVHDHRKPCPGSGTSLNHFGPDGRRLYPSNTSLYYLREGGRYGTQANNGACRFPSLKDETSPSPEGVEIYRMILRSSDETIWNDLRMMDIKAGGVWSDEDALRIESQILHLTAPPLCLTPDSHVTRIANTMLSSTMPSAFHAGSASRPHSRVDRATGHKLNSVELEQVENRDARRLQIMNMMRHGWSSTTQNDLPGESKAGMSRSSCLETLRKMRQNYAETAQEGPTVVPVTQNISDKSEAKKIPAATRKKRSKGNDESNTPDTKNAAASSTEAQRARTKRRKKDASPVEDKTKSKSDMSPARAESKTPSSPFIPGPSDSNNLSNTSVSTFLSPTSKGKSSPLVLPGGTELNKTPKITNSPILPSGKVKPTFSSGLFNSWNQQNS